MAIDAPKYEVVKKDEKIEIRDYREYIVAEVEIGSDYRSAMSQGFGVLAGYIFGDNKRKEHMVMTVPVTEQPSSRGEKIAMVAPVTSSAVADRKYRISFIMPSKFTLDTLPEPNSPEIKFRRVDAHRVAAIRFSGYLGDKLFNKKSKELQSWLGKNGIKPRSGFVSAQYNPPWIPGLFRRNEVLVEI
jgi:hypothetical protein